MVGVDAYGVTALFNPAAVRLFRLTETQAVGQPVDTLLVENQREAFRKLIGQFVEKCRSKVEQSTFEVTAARPQASSIRCEVHLTGICIQDTPFLCLFFRDVTERKKSAQKLYEAQKIEILDKFASDVAHEINNLLVAIQGYATLIRMASDESDRVRSASEIERLVKKGADVIKELRAFARSGGTRETSPKAPLDVNAVVRTVQHFILRTFTRRISVQVNLGGDLPSVHGSAEHLEQALMAICLNAQDAMLSGGTLTIETTAPALTDEFIQTHPGMPKGSVILLSVRDTGLGMSEKVLRRAFEPFFTTREAQGRTGLGLTMAYRTVKDHGGYLSVESIEGMGTTVLLYLPASARKEMAAGPADSNGDIVRGSGSILVIDDEPAVLTTTSKMLREIGYTVHEAANGADGIRAFEARRDEINLVVIDMKMPDKSGLETFEEIKKMSPDVKAIMTTGYSIRGETDAMFRMGLRALIQKPYTLAELSASISNILKVPAPANDQTDAFTKELESEQV